MNTAIETAIVERLHCLDEHRKAEVLDFVEYLAAKSSTASPPVSWPEIDPSCDFSRFIGTEPLAEDGVAFQRHIRDTEWP
ncbi:conserved hypothetical protein [Gammaproteobacteria bacterium]